MRDISPSNARAWLFRRACDSQLAERRGGGLPVAHFESVTHVESSDRGAREVPVRLNMEGASCIVGGGSGVGRVVCGSRKYRGRYARRPRFRATTAASALQPITHKCTPSHRPEPCVLLLTCPSSIHQHQPRSLPDLRVMLGGEIRLFPALHCK